MNILSVLITVGAAFLVALSTVLLKKCAHRLTLWNWFRDGLFVLGLFLYGLGNILFIFVLRNNELSVVFPLTSVQYVFATVMAHAHLKEKITRTLLVGICFIIVGSALVLIR